MRLLVIPALVGVLSLNFLMVNPDSKQAELIHHLQISAQEVEKIAELENERELERTKVLKIIERFNPEMPAGMKDAIFDEIYKMSQKYPNLNVELICATITHESGRKWDPKAVSKAGAMGLMQLMPYTGKGLAKYEDIEWTNAEEILFHPIYNIRMGCRYLSALIETYELEGGLAAYNGGEKIVEKWLANDKADGILWDETQNYIPFILKLYHEFRSYTL
ncbi:lytic transglycosylase domain-containing protein [candidate division KSB1 bacterium]|nr:lytic transglycosylase domain-containing protein [candidate division KSB1 bacterium]NIR68764.1 lytic transglycosylase domain-containing protein [candidate division KSB1 bacterium]NIS25580.1 lytic transglycosylase domain-containing protein [candidate division KSB1 bacterium]NIT72474.1 lytic transglycosylase domain-containing protein [candidate division KSB1 bacterium]NIU26258.1 lytic transglycosylase domain-containing protein [candidate division KSB1 bacterium]